MDFIVDGKVKFSLDVIEEIETERIKTINY
jgi:hypothetical protein